MTPHYRAKGKLFIDRLIYAGEEFTSELVPGRMWEPINEAAKARVEGRTTNYGPLDKIEPPIKHVSAIEIPESWRALTWPKKRALALQLGAQGTVTKDDAGSFIEAELERRAQKAAA